MKFVNIKSLNHFTALEKTINVFVIESPVEYRTLLLNVKESIVFSEDGKELDYSKNVIEILNPIDFNLNEKKNISVLYKILQSSINDEKRQMYGIIQEKSIEFLDFLIDSNNYSLTYNTEYDYNKFFNLFQLGFKEEESDYFKRLVNYIVTISEISRCNIVLSNNLTDYLDENEIIQLNKELEMKQIVLVDIKPNKQKNVEIIKDKNEYILI